MLGATGFLDIGGHRLEYSFDPAASAAGAVIVLLHEGLGCVGLWGEFRKTLARASGAGILAYSRDGYGASSPAALPRPLDYMQRHAREILPRVLDATFVGLKLGPVIEIPIGRKIAVSATAGLAGAYIDGSFKVREAYTFGSKAIGFRLGSISDSDFCTSSPMV